MRKSEEGNRKGKKDPNNALFHKKINVDIFAAAVGGRRPSDPGNANMKKKKETPGNKASIVKP